MGRRCSNPKAVTLRSEPIQFLEQRNIGDRANPNSRLQHLRHLQSEQMQKQSTPNCPTLNPSQLSRTRSRLWGPQGNASAAGKRKKRGCIFRSDLEKVGY